MLVTSVMISNEMFVVIIGFHIQKIDLMPTNEVYSPTTAANLASPTIPAKSPSVSGTEA